MAFRFRFDGTDVAFKICPVWLEGDYSGGPRLFAASGNVKFLTTRMTTGLVLF